MTFEQLPKYKQAALRKAGRSMMAGMFFNGINFGGLVFISNLVLILASALFFDYSSSVYIFCAIGDIILLKMMFSRNQQIAENFKTKVKNILEAK